MMNYTERDILIFLNSIGIDAYAISLIYDHFETFSNFWKSSKIELDQVTGLQDGVKQKILRMKSLERLAKNMEDSQNYNICTFLDDDFPDLLKIIPDPPKVLYYIGNFGLTKLPCLGVVGSRKLTAYGKSVCEEAVSEIARTGIVIVSGLAIGADAVAHKTALSVNGNTIGVLGTGIDICYPPSNRSLYEEMYQKGCLLTEFCPNSKPMPYHFPLRNRIISGLSEAVLIIEAKKQSGSLITARHAAEQGREVFAVPGNINSVYSKGTNALIMDGAIPFLEPLNILSMVPRFQMFQEHQRKEKAELPLSETEKAVLDVIQEGPKNVDSIAIRLKLSVSDANRILTLMELKGIIKEVSGGAFILKI